MKMPTYSLTDKIGQLKLAIGVELVPHTPAFPMGSYEIIVADPPWEYHSRETDESHRGRCPYPAMSDRDILELPIGMLSAKNAYCFLWATNNHLPLAFNCLSNWGFEYKTLYTWVKVSSKGTPHIGCGHWGRPCTEHFLLGVKGKPKSFTFLGLTDVPNVIEAKRQEHSRKPEQFYLLVERLAKALGGVTPLELFARSARSGWEAWGAEAESNATKHDSEH